MPSDNITISLRASRKNKLCVGTSESVPRFVQPLTRSVNYGYGDDSELLSDCHGTTEQGKSGAARSPSSGRGSKGEKKLASAAADTKGSQVHRFF